MTTQSAEAPVRVAVFLTRGMSLQGWRQAGLLEREAGVLRALQQRVGRLAVLTYGGREERAFLPQLGGAELLINRWNMGASLYSVLAPWLHAPALRRADVFRTTQLNGAWGAVIAKWRFRKPLVLRCGYLWSDEVAQTSRQRWKHWLAARLERIMVRAADRIIVATMADRRQVVDRHGVPEQRVTVIPNGVDVDCFQPEPGTVPQPGRICCVARCAPQKNLHVLLEAVEGLEGVQVALVGAGPLREALERHARQRRLNVDFLGVVPHGELPRVLRQAQVFVLPSRYEGHPKALLEAMACGLPVIGTNVQGIREVIRHGDNGYLCDNSPTALRAAIRELLADASCRQRLGAQARIDVSRRYALQPSIDQEAMVVRGLLQPERRPAGRRRASRASAMVAICLLTAGVLEAAARSWSWQPPGQGADYGFWPTGYGDLAPAQDGLWMIWPHRPYHVQTNADGLRNDAPWAAGAFRVLAVGDSITFGPYVPNEETWPAWLETMLQRDPALPGAIQVLNAGVAGYTITDEAAYLREKGLPARPDLVILGVSMNDISDFRPTQRRHFARPSASQGALAARTTARWLRQHSALYGFVQAFRIRQAVGTARRELQDADHVRITYGQPPDAESRQYWQGYERDLRDTIAMLKGAQVPLLLVAFPEFLQVPLAGHPETPQIALRRIAEETQTPFVDLLPAFRRDGNAETLYLVQRRSGANRGDAWDGNGHLSRYGHYVAAKSIAPSARLIARGRSELEREQAP